VLCKWFVFHNCYVCGFKSLIYEQIIIKQRDKEIDNKIYIQLGFLVKVEQLVT